MRHAAWTVGLVGWMLVGCQEETRRPGFPACESTDGSCGGGGGGGGIGGGIGMDSGRVTDATVDADGSVANPTGRVVIYQDILGPATGGATMQGAGWTLRSATDPTVTSVAGAMGEFVLPGVPTVAFEGVPGRYYGLRALPPVTRELGSYRLFGADGTAAVMPALAFDTLQFAVSGANGIVDLEAGHVIVLVRDSLDTTGMPVPNVTVATTTEAVPTFYDSVLQVGQLQIADRVTGPRGMAAVLNVSVPAGEGASRVVRLQASGVGAATAFDVTVFRRTITWVTYIPRS